MKGWKSYLLWEGIPFWMLFLCFGSISAINWPYERRLFTFQMDSPFWVFSHFNLLLLVTVLVKTCVASALLFVVRITRPKSYSDWYMFISLTVITIFLVFPALFIVLLGPASLNIMIQTHRVPGP